MTDQEIVEYMIALVPGYDAETMPNQASTIPGDEDWGYSLINYLLDHIQELLPDISQKRFFRCFGKAVPQTDYWRNLGENRPN
jgi:hypothetical protein